MQSNTGPIFSGERYLPLYRVLAEHGARHWAERLPQQLEAAFAKGRHGDLPKWRQVLDSLPVAQPSTTSLNAAVVQIGCADDRDEATGKQLQDRLLALHPWRKGPYNLFGIAIDSEWRSDWKWQRLQAHIAPLTNRLVLDIGCGNGYHCWRMLGQGAKTVLGIDPTLLSVMQFQTVRHFYGDAPIHVLPLAVEELPESLRLFDTVFSMGVFYHRRSPIDHLLELRDCLRPGGELILETLIIDARHGQLLLPEGRYAKMRNVWFIPSCATLLGWLKRCGFRNARVVDVTATTPDEQRSTPWMRFQSLSDFLDPDDPDLTVEGLPAPVRAVFIANS